MKPKEKSSNLNLKKTNFKSSFHNYNESDFAPFMRVSDPLNSTSSPGIPNLPDPVFTSPMPLNPCIPSFNSPHCLPPLSNQSFTKPHCAYNSPETDPRRAGHFDHISRSSVAKNTLKQILTEFGVQFCIDVFQEFDVPIRVDPMKCSLPSGPAFGLGKRNCPFQPISARALSPKFNEVPIFKNSFQIQKINFDPARHNSLFSYLNGNLQCPHSAKTASPKGLGKDSLVSIEALNHQGRDSRNILSRLFQVICGESPDKTWTATWDISQTQIFWLLLYKMGVLPDDWINSLEHSSRFPASKKKLKSVSHKTNMLINRILIKILNRFYYHAYNKQCAESENVLEELLKIGKSFLISKNFAHFSKIVGLRDNVKGPERFIDISKIQNQYLNRKMKEVLCSVLVKQPQTEQFYWEVRNQVLTQSNQFHSRHENKVFKKLKMAISNVENYFVGESQLPNVGLRVQQSRQPIFKKLKIPPSLQNWIEAYDQVKKLLLLIPLED